MKQVSWARQGLEPESPGTQLRALTPFQVLLRVSGILTTYTLSSLSHSQVPSHLFVRTSASWVGQLSSGMGGKGY